MTRPRLTLLGAEHPGPEGAGVTHQHRPLGAAGCPGRGRQELSLQLGGGPPQGGNSRHRELGCIEVAPGLFTPPGPALPLNLHREAQQSPGSSGPCLLAPSANLAGSQGGVLSRGRHPSNTPDARTKSHLHLRGGSFTCSHTILTSLGTTQKSNTCVSAFQRNYLEATSGEHASSSTHRTFQT